MPHGRQDAANHMKKMDQSNDGKITLAEIQNYLKEARPDGRQTFHLTLRPRQSYYAGSVQGLTTTFEEQARDSKYDGTKGAPTHVDITEDAKKEAAERAAGANTDIAGQDDQAHPTNEVGSPGLMFPGAPG
jgi:hypothetical protein